MKKLLAVITTIFLFPNSVIAQQTQDPPLVSLPVLIQCGPSEFTIALLTEKYKENPIALGMGQVIRPNGQPVRGQMLFWHSEDNRSFSITISFGQADTMSCLVMNGSDVDIFYDPNVEKEKL